MKTMMKISLLLFATAQCQGPINRTTNEHEIDNPNKHMDSVLIVNSIKNVPNNYLNKSPAGHVTVSQEDSSNSAGALISIDYNIDYNNNMKPQIGSIRSSQEVSSAVHPNDTSNQSVASLISDSEDASSIRFFSNHTIIRLKRASQGFGYRLIVPYQYILPEDFSLMVDNLSVSARLITAISLQNGLIDQSISADKALAELLNIGSVDLEQLEKFDKAKVDGFMKNLAGVNLAGSQDSMALEKRILLFEEWRKQYEAVGDFKDVALATGYFTTVGQMQGKSLPDIFTDAAVSITDFIAALQKTFNLPDDTADNSKNNKKHITTFTSLDFGVHFASTFEKDLSDWSAVLGEFSVLANSRFPLDSPQQKLLNLIYDFDQKKGQIDLTHATDQTIFTDMASKVQSVFSDAKSPFSSFTILHELVSARSSPLSSPRMYTSGFVNGHADLGTLATDAFKPYIKSLLAGFDPKVLESGLTPLKSLNAAINDLIPTWDSLSTTESVSAVEKLRVLSNLFGSLKSSPTSESVGKVADLGTRPQLLAKYSVDLVNLLRSSATLRSTLQSYSRKSKLIHTASILELTNEMKKYLPSKPTLDQTLVPSMITAFKKYKDNQKLLDSLNALKVLVEDMKQESGKQDFSKLLKSLAGGQKVVEAFVNHADTISYTAYFEKFKSLSTELPSLSAASQLVQQVRDLVADTQFTQQVSTMASSLSTSLSKVSALRAVPATFKANEDAYAELVKLKDLGKESETFGQSVAAMDNVRKVLEKKTELETFFVDGAGVKAEIEKLTDPNQKNELMNAWGNFEDTKTKVTGLLTNLETRRNKIASPNNSRRRRSTGGFSDYTSIFSEFTGLVDVDLDVAKRQKVLEVLAPLAPNMAPLKSSLDSFGSLNLHFASSNGPLSKVTAALGNMDNVFKSAVAAGSVTLPPGQKPPQPSGQNQNPIGPSLKNNLGQVSSTTQADPSDSGIGTWGWVGIIGGCVFVGGAAIGGFFCWYCGVCCKAKHEDQDVEAPKEKPVHVDKEKDADLEKQYKHMVKKNEQLVEQNDELAGDKECEKQKRMKAEQDQKKAEQDRIKADQDRMKAEQDKADGLKQLKEQQEKAEKAEKDKADGLKDLKEKQDKADKEGEEARRLAAKVGWKEYEADQKVWDAKKVEEKANQLVKDVTAERMDFLYDKMRQNRQYEYLYRFEEGPSGRRLIWTTKNDERYFELQAFTFISIYGFNPGREGNDVNATLAKLKIVEGKTLIQQYFEAKDSREILSVFVRCNLKRTRGFDNRFIEDKLNGKDDDNWIHANIMTMPVYGTMIVAQGPLLAEKAVEVNGDIVQCAKHDTRQAFLLNIMMQKMPHIVMTCRIDECAPYFTADKNGSMQMGQYEVTIKSCESMFNGEVERRVMIISRTTNYTKKKKTHHECVHWLFPKWLQGGGTPWTEEYPYFVDGLCYVHEQTQGAEGPIMVHGSMGTGRPAVFAGTRWIYQDLNIVGKPHNFWNMVADMRACRFGLFDNGYQINFTLCAGFHFFARSCKKTNHAATMHWQDCVDYYDYSPYAHEKVMEYLKPEASKKEVTQEKTDKTDKTDKKATKKKGKKEVEEKKKEEEPDLDLEEGPIDMDSDNSNSRKQKQIAAKEQREKKKNAEKRSKSQEQEKKAIREGELDVSVKMCKGKSQKKSKKSGKEKKAKSQKSQKVKKAKEQDTLKSEKKK